MLILVNYTHDVNTMHELVTFKKVRLKEWNAIILHERFIEIIKQNLQKSMIYRVFSTSLR